MERSKTFEEYVTKRCEETAKSNKEYCCLIHKSAQIIEKLKNTFSEEQLKMFLEYDEISAEAQSTLENEIYNLGLNDNLQINRS
jgi:sugar-specific transcriptional regulator TrmB